MRKKIRSTNKLWFSRQSLSDIRKRRRYKNEHRSSNREGKRNFIAFFSFCLVARKWVIDIFLFSDDWIVFNENEFERRYLTLRTMIWSSQVQKRNFSCSFSLSTSLIKASIYSETNFWLGFASVSRSFKIDSMRKERAPEFSPRSICRKTNDVQTSSIKRTRRRKQNLLLDGRTYFVNRFEILFFWRWEKTRTTLTRRLKRICRRGNGSSSITSHRWHKNTAEKKGNFKIRLENRPALSFDLFCCRCTSVLLSLSISRFCVWPKQRLALSVT